MRARPIIATLAAVSVLALSIGSAHADSGRRPAWQGNDDWNNGRHSNQGWRGHGANDDRHGGRHTERRSAKRWDRDDRGRHGRGNDDDDAFALLAIAGLTLFTIGVLSASQQSSYHAAETRATYVPVGEPVIWRDGGAYGSVTPVYEGRNASGRLCREYQKTVTIGGRQEDAYGTACRNADGSWSLSSQGD
ncbi:MAG: hypothetical protein EXQ98_07975 [Alphaproteobacteria bacterium]|nr:hypothetical protein [Alphaproteobacteria bacterium]